MNPHQTEISHYVPGCFMDITDTYEKKVEAMKCFKAQSHLIQYYTERAFMRGNHARRISGGYQLQIRGKFFQFLPGRGKRINLKGGKTNEVTVMCGRNCISDHDISCRMRQRSLHSGIHRGTEAASTSGKTDLIMGTGGTSGTYYIVGVAMGQAVTEHSDLANVIVQSSVGSMENLNLTATNQMQLGFSNEDGIYFAHYGTGVYEDMGEQDILGVMSLYMECRPDGYQS